MRSIFFETSHQLLWEVSHGNGCVEGGGRMALLLLLLLLWVMWMGPSVTTGHDAHNAHRALGRCIDLPLGCVFWCTGRGGGVGALIIILGALGVQQVFRRRYLRWWSGLLHLLVLLL